MGIDNMDKEIKYYTSSDGKKTPINQVETTHLTNALAKKYRDIFSTTNEDDFNNKLNEINDIKEEYYRRLNEFHDTVITKKEK